MGYISEKIKVIAELAKVKITVAVSFTTITGFVLFRHGFSTDMILPVVGIFLLACGSSVINHIQEFKTDMMMERTKNRPLPSGRIGLTGSWLTAVIFTTSGLLVLWKFSALTSFILGLTAMVWYNLIYTYLKRITYFAVIPGSVIGAIPPLVGWVSAGGPLVETRTLAIAFFFFVWQVPHFWLLMLKYGRQYEKAGFPSITKKTGFIARNMTFIWTITTGISATSLPLFNVVRSKITITGIILISGWLIFKFVQMLFLSDDEFKPVKYFMKINYFVLVVILLLITDHLFI